MLYYCWKDSTIVMMALADMLSIVVGYIQNWHNTHVIQVLLILDAIFRRVCLAL